MEITSTQIINEFVNSEEGQLNESTGLDLLLNEDLAEETLVKTLELQLQLESLEEQIMTEAGMGFGNRYASFIKRSFTGIDKKIDKRVEKAIKNIKTQKDKDKLIKLIDSMIQTAETKNYSSGRHGSGELPPFKNFVKASMKDVGAVLSVPALGPFLGILSPTFLSINRRKGRIEDFIKSLKILRKDVEAVKVPKE